MRTWLLKLEAMAAAVAFAEQGEWQMAQGIMEESDRERAQRQKPWRQENRAKAAQAGQLPGLTHITSGRTGSRARLLAFMQRTPVASL